MIWAPTRDGPRATLPAVKTVAKPCLLTSRINADDALRSLPGLFTAYPNG